MFEGIISDLLNRFLGTYIENLDCSKLKIGIWGGDVILKDLVIKKSAFDELGFPVKPAFGYLKHLCLKIPWSKMYTDKWEATIDGLVIVIVPSSVAFYDSQKEEQMLWDAKLATLTRIEEAKRKVQIKLSGKESKEPDGFVEKLMAHIIRNIQIKITNIHIRYEDAFSCSDKPFAAGFVLQNLSLQSTDKSWNVGLDTDRLVYKLMSLDGFLVYWSPNAKLLSQNDNTEEVLSTLYGVILEPDINYHLKPVFGPLNLSAKLQLNVHPENDETPFTIPKMSLTIVLTNLLIGLTRHQYEGMMNLLNSLESMQLASAYRKYRPNVITISGHGKLWWKYAFDCKLDDIRRIRRNWSWNHIEMHRKRTKLYKDLYKMKISGSKFSTEQKEEINSIERILDVFNITLARKQAELELEREGKTKAEAQSKRGWFGGWLSWKSPEQSTSQDNDDSIVKKIEAEMTAEERGKFYEAIGYCEDVPNEIPIEYVDFQISFRLDELQFKVEDELLEGRSVLVASTKKVICHFSKRSAASAIKVESSMGSFDVTGLYEEKFEQPLLVQSTLVTDEVPLLDVLIETNPITAECDTRIHIQAQPLNISYHSRTIAQITNIFSPPKNISLQQLQAATLTRLEVVKEKSVAGLQAAIDNHTILDLNVNIKSSKIIFPEFGFFKPDSSVIVVNLGSVKLASKPRENTESLTSIAKSEQTKEVILEKMRSSSYDCFTIHLTNVQVVVAEKDDDWSSALSSNAITPLHFLQPLSLNVDIYQCLISEDPNLPRLKVNATLPEIHITIIDKLLIKSVIIANNCFGHGASSINENECDPSLIVDIDQNQNVIGDEVAIMKLEKEGIRSAEDPLEKTTQFINVLLNFHISELVFELRRASEKDKSSEAVLKLVASEMAFDLTQRTYDMNIEIFLLNIAVYHLEGGLHPILTTNSGTDQHSPKLLKINMLKVDPKHPDIASVHNFVDQKIEVEIAQLSARLDQTALLSIFTYASNVQENILEQMPQAFDDQNQGTIQDDKKVHDTCAESTAKVSPLNKHKQSFAVRITEVELLISRSTVDLFKCSVKGLTVGITLMKQKMELNSCLERFSFVNSDPDAYYVQILSMEDGHAWDAYIEIYEERSINKNFFDVNNFDIVLKIEVGTPRIIFLNKTYCDIMLWVNNFQSAKQSIVSASQAAAEVAKRNMREAFAQGAKIKLDLTLKAPVVFIPHNSTTSQGVLLDLGEIIIDNNMELGKIRNELGYPYVLDNIKVKVQNIKISRKESLSEKKEILLLQPFSLNVNVSRNLSSSWFKDLPDIQLNGSLKTIQMEISEDDLSSVVTILQGNLEEIGDATSVVDEEISESQVESTANLNDELLAQHGKIYKKFSFHYTIEDVSLTLFTSETRMNFESLDNNKKEFAKMSLNSLSVKVDSFSDFSLAANVLLSNCILDDIRKDGCSQITRMVEKKISTEQKLSDPIIDVTFHQKKKNIFLNVKISEIIIILHLPFLQRMRKFLIVEPYQEMSDEDMVMEAFEDSQNIDKQFKGSKKEIMARKFKGEEDEKLAKSPSNDSVFQVQVKIDAPDIVFVDDLTNINSSCIFLHGEIQSTVKISTEQRNITAAIKDLQLYTSVFNPSKRKAHLSQILMKSEISFLSSATSSHADSIQLNLGTLNFNLAPDTVELIMKILSGLTIEEEADHANELATESKDWSYLWDPKPIDFSSLPNLHIEPAQEAAFDYNPVDLKSQSSSELPKGLGGETLFIELECLLITLESNHGSLSMPLIKIQSDCSLTAEGFFSSQLTFEGHISMEIAYYNHRQAIWEPLLEPVENISSHTSKIDYRPWIIKFEGHYTLDEKVEAKKATPVLLSPSSDGMEIIEFDRPSPLTKLVVSSQDPLEFTITKTFLEVASVLSNSFMAAYQGNLSVRKLTTAPYKIINKTGFTVAIKLKESGLQKLKETESDIENLIVETDGEVDLFENASKDFGHRRHSSLVAQCQIAGEKLINIKVVEVGVDCFIPVTRADNRYFPITPTSKLKEKLGLVASISVEEGCKIITISGCVKVTNELDTTVNIYFMREGGNEVEHVAELNPNEQSLLPLRAVYTSSSELFFAVKGYSICINPLVWKYLQNYPKLVQNLTCQPNTTKAKNAFQMPFYFCASCMVEQIFWKTTMRRTLDSMMVSVNLKPGIVFNNLLPVALHFYPPGEAIKKVLLPGDSICINHAQLGSMYLEVEIIDYQRNDWKCGKSIEQNPPEFSVWSFKKIGDENNGHILNLGLRVTALNGVHYLCLYCPFWMVNKTGFDLAYKADSLDSLVHHERDVKEVILFSFGSKSFFGKKKASLRVQDSEWSQKFPLDTVGSAAAVSCKHPSNDLIYRVSISIQLSSSGLTKIVTFSPYYKAHNQCPFDLQYCLEEDPFNNWKPIPSGDYTALWPSESMKMLKLRVEGTAEKTEAIHFDTSHSTLFKLKNKFGGIYVDVSESEGEVLLTFDKCIVCASSALILNHLRNSSLTLWQEGHEDDKIELSPQQMVYYTWKSAGSRRLLMFSCLGFSPITVALNEEKKGSIGNGLAGYAIWMEGAQRYLIVSEDPTLLELPSNYKILEQVKHEMEVAFNSIGFSVVNDITSQEIMYLSLTSSGVVWEHRKESGRKYRPFTEEQTILLEKAYLMHSAELKAFKENVKSHFILKPQLEVDFSLMKVFKPFNRPIRRTFQPGVWVQLQMMSSERNIHMKINKIQLDNQMSRGVMFPVVLSRVPPSKGVMAATVPKPFFEMSVIMCVESPLYTRFQYLRFLVQEFHLKIELPFLYLLTNMLHEKKNSHIIYSTAGYEKDLTIIHQSLIKSDKHPSKRDFYQHLHLSPIKMHLSFSLTGISDSGTEIPIGGQVIHLFLQSVGVTLTEIQDVVFRLGFFERQNCWLNVEGFQAEVVSHYTNQILKQFYVLALGLDVIGNPFGLVLGVTKGFGDLFYEPIQGAVEGPGEFAEGIFYGMRSFMGKTVGGAAGAFSRITGSLGKGMASLTLDEDYQRRRREDMHKIPADGLESFARSGKGVLTGVLDGMTGVFTKPVSGAKEEGVEGFFKGVGKGVIGLVTRPASGVIDFASGSFDAIMRATDVTEEGTPIRPQRYIKEDGIVRPYQHRQAAGSSLLNELQKGQFSETDIYASHALVKGGRCVLLASDKRIFLLSKNDLLGQWKIEWIHGYDELEGFPVLDQMEIILNVKEAKKMFGVFQSSKNVKRISFQETSDTMIVFEEISEAYVKYQNQTI